MIGSEQYDVVISGGGPAGITLAMQLKQTRPDTTILVVERAPEAPPDATHKVGESTVEISAHYLRDVLGLGDHLKNHQLQKFGLRMFFTADDNTDITKRLELGHSIFPQYSVGSFQLDRGRLESGLAGMLPERGVEFHWGVKTEDIELRPESDTHLVHLNGPDGKQTVEARWVIDATGRSSLLKRKLGLTKDVGHVANAAWFRLNTPMNIDDWTEDPEWRGRIREGQRRLSTNHLMGPGYWVWLIPLSSDTISVGIVVDPRLHPFETMNRFDRAMEWLRKWEPQCADEVAKYEDQLMDFRTMKNYAYGSEQVYSADRWCTAGEAGVFLDPLYSPGLDLIAMSNLLITDLVTRFLDGEDVEDTAAIHNQVLLQLFHGWLTVYENQYPVLGHPKAGLAKVVWDTGAYWAVPGLLYFQKTLPNLIDHPSILQGMARFSKGSELIQKFFREWVAVDTAQDKESFIGFYDFNFMKRLHIGMTADLGDKEMDEQFAENVELVDRLGGQLVRSVIADLERGGADEAQQRQIAEWRADADLMRLVSIADAKDAEEEAAGIVGTEESDIAGRDGWTALDRLVGAR